MVVVCGVFGFAIVCELGLKVFYWFYFAGVGVLGYVLWVCVCFMGFVWVLV